MNDVVQILLLLCLVSLEAAELVDEDRINSIHRLLQRGEDKSDPATTAFLAQVFAATLENDTAEDFAAFIDALAANATLGNDNQSNDSSDSNTFEDFESNFTTALSSAIDDDNTSISFDGSSSSSNGELEHEIDGDADLISENLLIGLATTQDTRNFLRNFLVMLTIGLIMEIVTWLQQDGQ
ncbi:hypothetical protein P3T76_015236 [Phytophthora citrophthora]|uniref:RxLR effector protein n=1 Tax=Phytophthora citrophthora TaxID=4793 RepID=A0AAD9FZR4_9STRA|nr:hypothetical protein P3T76_015236 [Phytophthora citrophthora]